MRHTVFRLPIWAAPLAVLTTACGDGGSPAQAPSAPTPDGLVPTALIAGSDGNLYGVTQEGGASGAGTVFMATPQGQERVLYSFAGGTRDGASPMSLLQGSDGNFYGITGGGGNVACPTGAAPAGSIPSTPALSPCGTVFEVSPDGTETILYYFTGQADGGGPTSLIQGSDGTLYGTTGSGGVINAQTGSLGGGVVFQITGPGSEQVVYAFDGSTAGMSPQSLTQAADGSLYVMVGEGGAALFGTIVHLTASGEASVLHSFGAGTDGRLPNAPVIESSDGNFYGVTPFGGTYGGGTFFQLTPAGVETILYSFGAGDVPVTFVAGSGGQFFGGTSSGGSDACGGDGCGTVFQITTSGVESMLHSFPPFTYGNLITQSGVGSIVELADGTLYGITGSEGVPISTGGGGTLFSLSPDGTFTTLHEFGAAAAASQ
jgi:uncharacterized repeat protein (TIGR03803 family)